MYIGDSPICHEHCIAKKTRGRKNIGIAVIVSMFRAILFESEYECFDNLPLLQFFFFQTTFSLLWELEASNIGRDNCNTYTIGPNILQ